jgi:hypothetical protein
MADYMKCAFQYYAFLMAWTMDETAWRHGIKGNVALLNENCWE